MASSVLALLIAGGVGKWGASAGQRKIGQVDTIAEMRTHATIVRYGVNGYKR